MGPTAIGEAVVEAGYGSKSANLGVIVSQRLAEMKDVKKTGRGLYSLRGRG